MRESNTEQEVMAAMRGEVVANGGRREKGVMDFVEDSMAGREVDADEFLAAVRRQAAERRREKEGQEEKKEGDVGVARGMWENLGRLSGMSCVVAFMLMGGLCPMAGWYYSMLKVVVFLFGVLAAVVFFRRGAEWRAVMAGLIAVLFNPWVRMGLSKAEWQIADLVCAVVVMVFLQLPRANRRGEG